MNAILPKSILFLIALSMFFAIFAYPLFGPLTGTRLSLLINLSAIVCLMSRNRYFQFVAFETVMPLLLGASFFIYSSAWFFVLGGTVWAVLSWLFLGLLSSSFAVLFSFCSSRDRIQIFRHLSALCTVSLLGIGVYYLQSGGTLGLTYQGRVFLNNNLPTGINRTLISLFALVVFTLAAGFSSAPKRKYKLLSFMVVTLNSLGFLLLALISGSRQALLVFFVFLIMLGFFHFRTLLSRKLLYLLLVLPFASFVFASLGSEFYAQSELGWLTRRYSDFLIFGLMTEGDQIRLQILDAAFLAAQSNYGFGIGPGNFPAWSGYPAENAYVQLLAEFGSVGSLFFIVILFVFTFSVIFSRGGARTRADGVVRLLLFCLVAVSFQFNELLQDSLFWSVFGVVWGSRQFLRKPKLPRHYSPNNLGTSRTARFQTKGAQFR